MTQCLRLHLAPARPGKHGKGDIVASVLFDLAGEPFIKRLRVGLVHTCVLVSVTITFGFQQELGIGGQGGAWLAGRGQAPPLLYTAALFLALGWVMAILAPDCW
jgi:hypothetical protein